MTKTIPAFIILLAIVFSTNKLYSQDLEQKIYKNELRFGAFQLLVSKGHLNYEHFLKNNKTSLTGIFELTHTGKYLGCLGGAQYRYYFLSYSEGKEIEIFYKGYISIGSEIEKSIKYQWGNHKDIINRYGIELALGFKLIVFNRITADLNIGALYNQASILSESGKSYDLGKLDIGYNGFKPTANLTFGFRF